MTAPSLKESAREVYWAKIGDAYSNELTRICFRRSAATESWLSVGPLTDSHLTSASATSRRFHGGAAWSKTDSPDGLILGAPGCGTSLHSLVAVVAGFLQDSTMRSRLQFIGRHPVWALSHFFPTKVRLVAVQVSAGATYDPAILKSSISKQPLQRPLEKWTPPLAHA